VRELASAEEALGAENHDQQDRYAGAEDGKAEDLRDLDGA
jgi:hypothetical protein